MDISFSREEEAFRQHVRSWLEHNLPAGPPIGLSYRIRPEEIPRRRDWQRRAYEAGLVGVSWPVAYGGRGQSLVHEMIVEQELLRAGAPRWVGGVAIAIFGPTLLAYGSEEQKRRYLPRLLSGEQLWCQGYSEPGAGSDLASLRTRAELVGDQFVVNGQKVWSSQSRHADMMFALVRTEPSAPKHRGISYLLIDMKTPGMVVRPLKQMTGDAEFSEVFFDNARVPRANLVGQLNQGWTIANDTLFHERVSLGSNATAQSLFDKLRRLAARPIASGPGAADPLWRQRLAELEISVEAMRFHYLRQLSQVLHGRHAGIEGLVNKLAGTELNYALGAAAMAWLNSYALLQEDEELALDGAYWPLEWMFSLALTIGGGTSQVQKNIIAERGLKMPR